MHFSLTKRASSGHDYRGFTLVEVMVSLVVFSLGLLGMAKLVLVTSHSNDSAYLRSQATALAYQILDNMRANMSAATTSGYDIALGSAPSAPTSCVATGTACSPTQQASWDVYSWTQHLNSANNLGGGLPSGTGSVVTSGTVPVTATITVQWDDSAAQCAFASSSAPCTIGSKSPMAITLETSLQ
jgi:type IV pilus assembly protein PilV